MINYPPNKSDKTTKCVTILFVYSQWDTVTLTQGDNSMLLDLEDRISHTCRSGNVPKRLNKRSYIVSEGKVVPDWREHGVHTGIHHNSVKIK